MLSVFAILVLTVGLLGVLLGRHGERGVLVR
jgi:hypothetical protein